MKSILLCVLVLCLFAAYSAEENLFTADLNSADVDFLFQQSMRVFRPKDAKGFRKTASRDLSGGFKRTPSVKTKTIPKAKSNHFRAATKKILKTLPTFSKVKKAMLKGKGRKIARKSSRKGRKSSRKSSRKGRKASRKFGRKGRKISRKGRKLSRKAGRKTGKISKSTPTKKPVKGTFRKQIRKVSKPKSTPTKKSVGKRKASRKTGRKGRKASRKGRKGKKLTGLAKQLAENTERIKKLLQQKSQQIHKLFKKRTQQLKKKFRKTGRKCGKSTRKASRKSSRKASRKSSRKASRKSTRKVSRKDRKTSRKGRKGRKTSRKVSKVNNWRVKYVKVQKDQGNPFNSKHVHKNERPTKEDLSLIQE